MDKKIHVRVTAQPRKRVQPSKLAKPAKRYGPFTRFEEAELPGPPDYLIHSVQGDGDVGDAQYNIGKRRNPRFIEEIFTTDAVKATLSKKGYTNFSNFLSGPSRIRAYDFSNPRSPQLLDNLADAATIRFLSLDSLTGSLLLARSGTAANADTVKSVNVSDPTNIVLLDTKILSSLVPPQFSCDAMAVKGGYGYVINQDFTGTAVRRSYLGTYQLSPTISQLNTVTLESVVSGTCIDIGGTGHNAMTARMAIGDGMLYAGFHFRQTGTFQAGGPGTLPACLNCVEAAQWLAACSTCAECLSCISIAIQAASCADCAACIAACSAQCASCSACTAAITSCVSTGGCVDIDQQDTQLLIFSLASPAAPVQVNGFAPCTFANHVLHMHVSDDKTRLYVIVSTGEDLSVGGTLTTRGNGQELQVYGIAEPNGTPDSPALLGSLALPDRLVAGPTGIIASTTSLYGTNDKFAYVGFSRTGFLETDVHGYIGVYNCASGTPMLVRFVETPYQGLTDLLCLSGKGENL